MKPVIVERQASGDRLREMEATIYCNGRSLVLTGTYPEYLGGLHGLTAETTTVGKIVKDLPEGSVCLDVGANIGATAIQMAALRPDLTIIALEPVPDNARCLRQNLAVNSITNVEVREVAVSNSRGVIPIANNGPYSSFSPGSDLVCQTELLDDFAHLPVAFVKIDTEGFEPNVIDGARKMFLRHNPLVLMEFNSWWMMVHGYSPIEFSRAIFGACDVLALYHQDVAGELPTQPVSIAHTNITRHGSVSDVLLRPRDAFPSFAEMVGLLPR